MSSPSAVTPQAVRRHRTSAALLAILALVSAVGAPTAGAAEPRAADDVATRIVERAPRSDAAPAVVPMDDEILIRYAPGTTELERRRTARTNDLTLVRSSPDGLTEVVVAPGRSTTTVRRELRDDPGVVAVAANGQRELAEDISGEPDLPDLWGLHNTGQKVGPAALAGVADVDIDAPAALHLGLGSPSIVVAVIDDGVDLAHPDLVDRAWTNPGEAGAKATNGLDDDGNGYVDDVHGWDFCNGDNSVHDAGQDGHGTHVAGTIAASLNGIGVVGVAPGIRLMALKFIDDGWGCGRDDMAVAAIDYAASFGVRIINASWGGPQPSSVLDVAIADSDALFVAAAGNTGTDLDAGAVRFYPASSNLANIIAVAAIDHAGRLASFSNYGSSTVDIAAPGKDILSTYPADGCSAPCYAWSAGTSMAAPHVSGVAALVGTHEPTLLAAPISLRGRILATGRILDATVGKTSTGRLLNAVHAIDKVKPAVAAPNRYRIATGTRIGARSIATRVQWPAAADALTGVVAYRLQRGTVDGWTDVPVAGSATAAATSLRYGAATTFRLRATDGAGNIGGPVDGPVVTATLNGEATSLATWSSGWSTTASTSATNDTLRTTLRRGAWVSITFTGRSFALVSPLGRGLGRYQVYVDGRYARTVDLDGAPAAGVVVFSAAWTSKAAHTVRLVVIETANRDRVDIDGFVIVR